MKLMQFRSIWINDYTREERKEYTAIHGDNEYNWPEKVDYGPIFLDMHSIIRINPTRRYKNGLTIELACGGIHCVEMPLPKLIRILQSEGLMFNESTTENNDDPTP